MPSDQPIRRFQDIIDNVDAIQRYIKGMSEQTFLGDDLVVDATERCLSRISEAATKLGPLAEPLAPDQPWRNIRGLGNHLRHAYDLVGREDLWRIISDNLGSLRESCRAAIQKLESEPEGPLSSAAKSK